MKIVLSVLWLACNAIIVEKGQSAILVCIDQEKQAEIRKETTLDSCCMFRKWFFDSKQWFKSRVSRIIFRYIKQRSLF